MTTTAESPAVASTDRLITIYRIIAFAEAVSWGALLIAMLFKYAFVQNAAGVRIVGPIHGTIFLGYLVATLAVSVKCQWRAKTTLIGLFAAIPPFTTVVFEKWAERNGHLKPSS